MAVDDHLKVVASNLRRAAQEANNTASNLRSQLSSTEKEINDHINKYKKEMLALEATLVSQMQEEGSNIKDDIARGIRNLQGMVDEKQQQIKEEKERVNQQVQFFEQQINQLNSEADSYENRAGQLT